MNIIRAIFKSFNAAANAAYRTFIADGRPQETIDGVMFQHYGFRSMPIAGTDMITMQYGNNNVSVAENDGNTAPLGLTEGDVALYLAKIPGDVPYYSPPPARSSHNPTSVLLTKINNHYYLLLNADNYIGLQAERVTILSDLSYIVNTADATIGNLGTDPMTPNTTYYLVTKDWLDKTYAAHTHSYVNGTTPAITGGPAGGTSTFPTTTVLKAN